MLAVAFFLAVWDTVTTSSCGAVDANAFLNQQHAPLETVWCEQQSLKKLHTTFTRPNDSSNNTSQMCAYTLAQYRNHKKPDLINSKTNSNPISVTEAKMSCLYVI